MESLSKDKLKLFVWVLVLALLLLGGALAINGLTDVKDIKPGLTMDSLSCTYTYNGEIIRYYVFVDPETRIEYLVNDRGGMTPRLDYNGEVMHLNDGSG